MKMTDLFAYFDSVNILLQNPKMIFQFLNTSILLLVLTIVKMKLIFFMIAISDIFTLARWTLMKTM